MSVMSAGDIPPPLPNRRPNAVPLRQSAVDRPNAVPLRQSAVDRTTNPLQGSPTDIQTRNNNQRNSPRTPTDNAHMVAHQRNSPRTQSNSTHLGGQNNLRPTHASTSQTLPRPQSSRPLPQVPNEHNSPGQTCATKQHSSIAPALPPTRSKSVSIHHSQTHPHKNTFVHSKSEPESFETPPALPPRTTSILPAQPKQKTTLKHNYEDFSLPFQTPQSVVHQQNKKGDTDSQFEGRFRFHTVTEFPVPEEFKNCPKTYSSTNTSTGRPAFHDPL